MWKYSIYQTQILCLFRFNHAAGHTNLLCHVIPYEPGKPLCPSEPWDDTKIDFRLPEFCFLRGINKITGHGYFTPPAKGKTIHTCNNGNIKLFNPEKQVLPITAEFFCLKGSKVSHMLHIRTGHKGLAVATLLGTLAGGGVWLALTQAATVNQEVAALPLVLLFTARVSGLVALGLTPVVHYARVDKPPKLVTCAVLLIIALPWLLAMLLPAPQG